MVSGYGSVVVVEGVCGDIRNGWTVHFAAGKLTDWRPHDFGACFGVDVAESFFAVLSDVLAYTF